MVSSTWTAPACTESKQHSVFTCRVRMLQCPWTGDAISRDMSDEQIARFKRRIRHTSTATSATLENVLKFLGLEPEVQDLQTQGISGEDYRLRLIDLFVKEFLSVGFEERRRARAEQRRQWEREQEEIERTREEMERAGIRAELAAAAILQGREDRGAELQQVLDQEAWECPICFREFTDPNQISVTCHRPENASLSFAQHKACAQCAGQCVTCPMCRAPAKDLPLPLFWNGCPLKMQMGENPFLLRVDARFAGTELTSKNRLRL